MNFSDEKYSYEEQQEQFRKWLFSDNDITSRLIVLYNDMVEKRTIRNGILNNSTIEEEDKEIIEEEMSNAEMALMRASELIMQDFTKMTEFLGGIANEKSNEYFKKMLSLLSEMNELIFANEDLYHEYGRDLEDPSQQWPRFNCFKYNNKKHTSK